MAVMQREISRSWTYFSMAWSTGIAYAIATLFYQTGTFSQHPLSTILWYLIVAIALYATYLFLRFKTIPLTESDLPISSHRENCHD